jgi:hypothetical protein
MKTKKYLAGSILFFTIIACAIPSLNHAPPPFDPATIPTMVVLTAAALASQTAAATTPLPSETSPPTLLPAESATATPRVSFLGTSLYLRDDQTTVFTDHRTGIELIIPAGWLALRINEPEYYDAWGLPEFSDPSFQRLLTNMQNLDPNKSRLFVVDMQEEHQLGGFVTNINLLWNETENMSFDNEADLQEAADSITLSKLDILTTNISVTSNGIPIGVITSKRAGTTMEAFHKQVFVQAHTGTLLITFTTSKDLKKTILPAFDAMIETMTLVKE